MFLGLEQLDSNALTLMFSTFIISQIIYQFMSPFTCPRKLGYKTEIEWSIHCVSLVHSLIISLLAYPILFDPILAADPVLFLATFTCTYIVIRILSLRG
jgi:hypothetical protein